MVLQSLEGLPLRHLNKVIIIITIIINIIYLVCLSWCRPISLTIPSFCLFFFLSRTLLNLCDPPLVFYLRYCSTGYHAEENSSLHILQYSSFVERIHGISAANAVPSKVKQSNGTFCIQVREISCYLLLIIKSLNNMKETTSRWIQITVIPFLSKKCTFGTERVSVLEICLSYKVLKMTGQKKRRD